MLCSCLDSDSDGPCKLFAGPVACFTNGDWEELVSKRGVRCCISILPIGRPGVSRADVLDPLPRYHRILHAWDDTVLQPDVIRAVIDLEVSTFIHCNSGENRSSMLAACWLLWHTQPALAVNGEKAWKEVLASRAKTLGHEPKTRPAMHENVKKFADYLTVLATTTGAK